MLKFNAKEFTQLCFLLEQLQGDCIYEEQAADASKLEAAWRQDVGTRLHFIAREAEKIGLSATCDQCARIASVAKSRVEIPNICYLLRDLEGTITSELATPVFLKLRDDLAQFYDDEDKAYFGDEVKRLFPRATHDIAEAHRCFALERWDACVHHLMLATEHALRLWARALRLTTKNPTILEDQRRILDAAEAKRKELLNTKRTRQREAQLKYISETLGHFGFVKDAWRNHSAHGRERYDERKAKKLMNHIEAFMRVLAEKP